MGQGSGVAVSCGVGRRRGSDPMLVWLWCRLAATAPIQPLAWELAYAEGAALKRKKKERKRKRHVKICVACHSRPSIVWPVFMAFPEWACSDGQKIGEYWLVAGLGVGGKGHSCYGSNFLWVISTF